jgi:hypothetical protein
MEKYKVTCVEDNKNFIATDAFLKLKKSFKELKNRKGRIIHVIGAPGTGKSTNIYQAQQVLDLNIYNAKMTLKNKKINPKEVYMAFINTMKQDFGVKTEDDVYKEMSKYDTVLFADELLDPEALNKEKIGLGQWIHANRLKSIFFYFLLIYKYLKYLKEFKKVNIVFHTTWTFIIKETKYDLLTDFSLLSSIFKGILMLFFEVIEISYTPSETIKIVKSYFKDINEEQIKNYIKKYGNKPRLILNALENDLKPLKSHNTNLIITNTLIKI